MRDSTSGRPINPTTLALKRYKVRFSIAMAAYVIVLFASIRVAREFPGNPFHTIAALLPVIPVAFVFAFVVQFVNSIDELERQIHFEALALAGGLTALAAVTYGFLEVAGFAHLSAWFTYVFFMMAWLIANPFVRRKYQ